ncbi:hypothetical protein CK203_010201 [Vitis vinifera]|uniref:Uncharacterized protein n=1 Tax=Vitis vinifera TaxID=29760 RepID=A0A438JXL8_VITVI|nr:hypothetical protein CK203_010201 [Vitis vinifera]
MGGDKGSGPDGFSMAWAWGGKILDAVLVANDAIDLRTRSSKVVVMDTFLYTVRHVPLVNGSYIFFFRALKVCSWMTLFPLVGTNSGGINRSGDQTLKGTFPLGGWRRWLLSLIVLKASCEITSSRGRQIKADGGQKLGDLE